MPPASNNSTEKSHKVWKWIVTIVYGVPLLILLPFFFGAITGGLISKFTNDWTLALFETWQFFLVPIILTAAITLVWWKSLKWAFLGLPVFIFTLIAVIQIVQTHSAVELQAQQHRLNEPGSY